MQKEKRFLQPWKTEDKSEDILWSSLTLEDGLDMPNFSFKSDILQYQSYGSHE